PANLLALEATLEDLDLNMVKAYSGNEALGFLVENEFALVILDVQMPEMDGFEVANLMKKNEITRNIPIIFVTALNKDKEFINKGYEAGAVDYLSKPIEPEILISKVRVLADLYRSKSTVKEQAELLEKKAFFDPLTQLPNRSLFFNRLDHSIAQSKRNDEKLAIVFLDLDRFKYINDTLGHAVGDQLLQDVAKRLSDCARKSDTIARLGGDEFTLILSDISTSRGAAIVAQKILKSLTEPFFLLNGEYTIGASIGICLYPSNGVSAEELVKNADIAMYQAKHNGKNNYQFFTTEM
ncbi:MAG: diguanylate cyclase, partial [Cytophagales bacterium]|nr:diguanylate cyclase [Cytophagales bacterium]